MNPGRPIDRKEMLQHVWGGNTREMETRTVDMHIRRLREKLERDPTSPERIVTVRNKGYMFARTRREIPASLVAGLCRLRAGGRRGAWAGSRS